VSREDKDWRLVASAAQEEMIRHALAMIHSANLIRAELDFPLYQLRQARRPSSRPSADDERRYAEAEYQRQAREGGIH
jgi:hypothetical protein